MDRNFFTKNKKKIIIAIAVIAIFLIGFSLINSTYSLFYYENYAPEVENYSTGTLSITAGSKGNNISLTNVVPKSDEDGVKTTPYTFTITNTGNLDYKFNVKLLAANTSNLSSEYIKLKVDDGAITTLLDSQQKQNNIIKSEVTLRAKESIDISIYVWLSTGTPNTEIGKVFNSNIFIDAIAVYSGYKLPSEYQEVDYIESAGNSYIVTNINCGYNDTVTIVTTGEFSSSNNGSWSGVNAYLQQKFTSNTVSDGENPLTINSIDTITTSYNGSSHVQTTTVASSGSSVTRTWNTSAYGGKIMFFQLGNGETAYANHGVKGKLYRGKVYVSNTLKADLIPCYRISDNVVGMYDIAQNIFFAGSGTESFTKGNNV